jgi:hypothetical protein
MLRRVHELARELHAANDIVPFARFDEDGTTNTDGVDERDDLGSVHGGGEIVGAAVDGDNMQPAAASRQRPPPPLRTPWRVFDARDGVERISPLRKLLLAPAADRKHWRMLRRCVSPLREDPRAHGREGECGDEAKRLSMRQHIENACGLTAGTRIALEPAHGAATRSAARDVLAHLLARDDPWETGAVYGWEYDQ